MLHELKSRLERLVRQKMARTVGLTQLAERLTAVENELHRVTTLLARHEAEAERAATLRARELRQRIAFDEACLARFRGTREDISTRMRHWIPVLSARFEGHLAGLHAVDLGCGRGEWLELLQQQGLRVRGVDASAKLQAECQKLGIDVDVADVLGWLENAASGSVDIATCFHLIEHLEVDDRHHVLRELYRVVRPGGVIIIETPNPENLEVGAWRFYMDPTHRQPMPPELLAFMAEFHGFGAVDTHRLHPVADSDANMWHARLHGPQDFGIIATRLPDARFRGDC
jgi:2-polyprenyl-3-methyl-5-hydroxy-6-metoxy-1,4-benzoquinol methylase